MNMNKKEKLLETALRLFVENGIDLTPTAKIAAEAGVATGTLFHHFKNKEALVNSLYLKVKTGIADAISQGLPEIEENRQILHHIWNNFISWSIDNPEQCQFNSQFCESPIITKDTKKQLAEETFRFLYEIFEKRKKRKITRDLPVDFLASIGSSLLVRSARYFIANPEAFKVPVIADEAFDAFCGMLVKT